MASIAPSRRHMSPFAGTPTRCSFGVAARANGPKAAAEREARLTDGMPRHRRLALAARMAADTSVRDSIVPTRSASRLPELGPHGEGWVVLQLLFGAAIAGGGFVGVYWPGSVESFVGVLGLLLAVVGALLVVLGVLSLGSSFTPLPRPAPAAGWNLPARASSGVRGRDLGRTWLVVCRGAARPRPHGAARPAHRPEGAARGDVVDRALPRIRALPGAHTAPVCAMALLKPRAFAVVLAINATRRVCRVSGKVPSAASRLASAILSSEAAQGSDRRRRTLEGPGRVHPLPKES